MHKRRLRILDAGCIAERLAVGSGLHDRGDLQLEYNRRSPGLGLLRRLGQGLEQFGCV